MEPIFSTPELQNNEALKGFATSDDVGKAYLDLRGKVDSGSIDILPEDIRKDPTVANYKTIADLAKGHIETKKMVGTIKKAPATPAEYKFSPVEGLSEKVKTDANFQKVLAEGAHKLGLAPEQADGMHKLAMGYYSTLYSNAEKAREETRQKNEAALKLEWGDKYDENLNRTIRMVQAAGGDEAINDLAPALKNAPLALKAFAKIASLISEDGFKTLGPAGGAGDGTSADEKEFNEFSNAVRTNDQKHPLMNDRHVDHQKATKRWAELNDIHFKAHP